MGSLIFFSLHTLHCKSPCWLSKFDFKRFKALLKYLSCLKFRFILIYKYKKNWFSPPRLILRNEDPGLAKIPDPGLCNSNEGSLLNEY